MVQRNVIIEPNINFTTGSVVSYFCNENSSRTDVATSVCTEERKWMPDPNEYTCENTEGMSIWLETCHIFQIVIAKFLYYGHPMGLLKLS